MAAWAWLAFVAFATLSPLSLRPELTYTEPKLVVALEHVGAFGLVGLLFFLSYPDRHHLVCGLVFGSAVALELLQFFVPDRDPRSIDALEKIVGGGAGILAAVWLLDRVFALGASANRWAKRDPEALELLAGASALILFALAMVIVRNW